MVILDTSYLFAFFQSIDDHHPKAVAIARELEHESCYVPFLVFQELMTLLTSKYSSQEATRLMKVLLAEDSPIKLLKIDMDYFDETVALFRQLEPHRFSFVDVLLIALHRDFNAPVVTFDQRLQRALA